MTRQIPYRLYNPNAQQSAPVNEQQPGMQSTEGYNESFAGHTQTFAGHAQTTASYEQNTATYPQGDDEEDDYPQRGEEEEQPVLKHEQSPMSTSFVISDMEGRVSDYNMVCEDCYEALSSEEKRLLKYHNTPGKGESCVLCETDYGTAEAFTKPFCDFLHENPTVFHAVNYFKSKLAYLDFEELSPRDSWAGKVKAGGKYYVTRNGTSIVAFTVGQSYKAGNGVAMIGGHIDALTAKLKPVSNKPDKSGYVQLGVAPYAGGLNATWWDRDLSIGGRVMIRDPETEKTTTKLVQLDWPVAKIPTLAPHFGEGMMGQNNPETQAVPIIGLNPFPVNPKPLGSTGSFVNTQPRRLVEIISKQLAIKDVNTIVSWELELFDVQPPTTGGMDREFIFAGRIDDKLCSWPAMMALLSSKSASHEGHIKLVALFDNEEIGSLTRQGARGNLLPLVVERAVEALNPASYGPGVLGQTYAKSFLLSADVTHAGNPNFLGSYLPEHVPKLNTGMVLCQDPNGHMTTNAVSTAILQRVGEVAGLTTQVFQIRNDSRSGGTIGPALSSMLGVRAADAGLPQLSMHSVRATTGALDPGLGVQFFKSFLDSWAKIEEEFEEE